MRRDLFALLLSAVFCLTCSQQKKDFHSGRNKLETTREKFSYALGYDLGPNMKNIKSGVDLQYFMAGLADYLEERPSLLTERERQDIRSEEFTRIGEEYMRRQKELEQERLQAGEAFLAANKKKPGVITTASGLQYEILAEGEGQQPGPDDRVKIKYHGTFLDGKEVESTDKLQRGFTICLVKGVIPAWTEAFQLMRPGAKFRLFIPSPLAYGKIGRDPDIPSNTVLIYEMELVEINPAN